MADSDQDPSQKTEEPTDKRKADALKKGQVAKSQEVGHWFMMLGIAGTLMILIGHAGSTMLGGLSAFVASPDQIAISSGGLQNLLIVVLEQLAVGILPILLVLALVAAVGSMIQHPPIFTTEKLKPQLSKISPIAGFKRLFSSRSLMEFAKGIAKLALVALVAFSLIWPDMNALPQLMAVEPLQVMEFVRDKSVIMVGGVMAVMTVVAALDFAYQKYKTHQDMKMSRKEIKDEQKESDGDPMIKQRIRQLRQERARRRMMAAVPTADVIIANPTHFAVALKYDMDTMAAPACVAKGVDAVALKIREVGEENGVPVIENPPLARALHATVELDEPIPVEHYRAVAEVISYVMQLKNRYSAGGAGTR
ncbi:MAG: flagellar biosynthesis protein FlhB [Minwuia sp.]|uniref:flagellar biosynthesis protein FlhB n=1 Tax=Minwuia sp. TaxID=2493630 RepID=UPI003A843D0D